MLAKREEERCAQKQPRNHATKRLRGSVDQKNGAGKPTDQAGKDQRNQDTPRHVEFLRVGTTARGRPNPKGKRVRGVCWNFRDASEQQGRKCDKTAASRHGVHPSAERASEKKKDGVIKVQAEVVSRLAVDAPATSAAYYGCRKTKTTTGRLGDGEWRRARVRGGRRRRACRRCCGDDF